MFDPFFAAPGQLLAGAITGFLFGFLLQKGGVTRFEVIVNQFLLKDFTVLKVMGTAIVVGAVGVYGMLQLGMIEGLHIKSAHLLGNMLGGVIFGVGMAVLGYCPGTGVAAIGDGSRHAIPGVLGMLCGAALYAEADPWVSRHILNIASLGEETLVTATGLSPWWLIAALAVIAVLGLWLLEQWEHRRAAV
jgi:uncharacterized membrane protein YedE/YeeE